MRKIEEEILVLIVKAQAASDEAKVHYGHLEWDDGFLKKVGEDPYKTSFFYNLKANYIKKALRLCRKTNDIRIRYRIVISTNEKGQKSFIVYFSTHYGQVSFHSPWKEGLAMGLKPEGSVISWTGKKSGSRKNCLRIQKALGLSLLEEGGEGFKKKK